MGQMKKHIKLWGSRSLAVVVLVVGVQQWGMPMYKRYMTPKKTTVFIPTAKVRTGQFVVSFHEIGTLEAERSVPVNAESGGKVITLLPDGKPVKTGDVIAQMDTTDIEKEIRNKELAHQNALADVNRAKAELEILKESNRTDFEKAQADYDFNTTELERAEKDLEKAKRLADDKLVPRSDVDKAEIEVRAKKLAVLKGEKDLALKKKEIESKEQQKLADVRNVEFKANMAKIELENSQEQLKNALIKAPASGLVVISKTWSPDGRRKLKEGDSVHPRQNICNLPDLASMLAKVQVGEADAPKVRVGMPVLIRLEAVPNKIFHGTVSDISSLAAEGDPWDSGTTPGRKSFEVTIDVREVDPKNLKPGMTTDIEFVSDTIKLATYIPIECINERNGKTYAFIKQGKRYVKTQVTTGKHNDNFICVTKGLTKGQVVALRDPTRPLDHQEAGSSAPDADDKKDKKEAAPIPGAANGKEK